MSRTPQLRSTLLLATLLGAVTTKAVAQQDFSKVEIKVTPVAEGIYMLQGAGGNIGLSVGSDDAFIVDDQYAPLTPKIKAAIATVTQRPVRFVLNTHWHGDHTGGNEAMAASGSIVVAHDNVRRRMSAEQFITAFNQRVPASPSAALPVVTFSDTVTFHVNGETIRALHVRNAHTDGDAIVSFGRANVMHLGDTFFNGMYPYIDLSTGGSIDGMIAAVNGALANGNTTTRFIPGHGPLASRADLVRYRDVLVAARTRVTRLITQRLTLAQIVAAKPLADYDAQWGKGFINPQQFVTSVYTSVSEQRQSRRAVRREGSR